ncbi:hypothetical protein EOM09_06050 [bacterium]|nr:hypothetical protein [bacterium]
MINPVYQQMVYRVGIQNLIPLTSDKNLTFEDLQILANQSTTMPDNVGSAIYFLLNNFKKLSILGDNDVKGISESDLKAFSQKGLDLIA